MSRAIVKSNPAAVVIIQGDHGSKLHLDQGSLKDTDVEEAFSTLMCIRAPEPVTRALYDEMSSVNTFRLVLRGLFEADLPALPDRSYYSTWEDPLGFEEVTDRLSAN